VRRCLSVCTSEYDTKFQLQNVRVLFFRSSSSVFGCAQLSCCCWLIGWCQRVKHSRTRNQPAKKKEEKRKGGTMMDEGALRVRVRVCVSSSSSSLIRNRTESDECAFLCNSNKPNSSGAYCSLLQRSLSSASSISSSNPIRRYADDQAPATAIARRKKLLLLLLGGQKPTHSLHLSFVSCRCVSNDNQIPIPLLLSLCLGSLFSVAPHNNMNCSRSNKRRRRWRPLPPPPPPSPPVINNNNNEKRRRRRKTRSSS